MKHLAIEKLVRWAYRDELPKAQPSGDVWGRDVTHLGVASGWGAVSEFGKLLAVVDVNDYGVVPNRFAGDDPHPDALRIARAVASLDELELTLPDDWSPLAEFGDLGDDGRRATEAAMARISRLDADGVRRLRQTPRALVVRHAILGDTPDWQCEPPEVRFVKGSRGGAPLWFITRRVPVGEDCQGQTIYGDVEQDGFDARRRRPFPGAYRKTFLDPDPTDAAVSRAEYEVWHAALGVLEAELAGDLVDFEPLPTAYPARPWETVPPPPARVLPDLTPPKAPALVPGRSASAQRREDA